MKVVVPPYLNCSPLFIALEEGFFAEQRIDVEFVTLNLSSQAIAPLLTGDVDVVMGILYPAYFNAVAKGASLRIVACRGYLAGGDCSWYALMARSGLLHSGRLSTLSGLAGLKHGLNSPSAHNSYFFDLLLDQAGLPADSVLGVS